MLNLIPIKERDLKNIKDVVNSTFRVCMRVLVLTQKVNLKTERICIGNHVVLSAIIRE